MQNLKSYSVLIGILVAHQLWVNFIQNVLYPIHFTPHNLFILELIGKRVDVPGGIYSFLNSGNIIILWLISRRIFANRFSIVPAVIYAISPWSGYLVVANSFYIYLLFLLLLIFYGLMVINSKKFLAPVLIISGTTLILYSSFLMFFIIPLLILVIIFFKLISFNKLKLALSLIAILLLPVFIYMNGNRLTFQNILQSEITTFSDPGLLNMVNSYQGAARQANLGILARISENKYIFSTELLLLKFAKHFTPSTYFTSQEKLLNFSFTPPIYLGFLVPFIFGFYQIFKVPHLRKGLILSILLTIPSVLSKPMIDLNRLFIFMPVIVLVVAFGLIFLFTQKKKIYMVILSITIFIIIFQALVTISDIQLREKARFERYFENKSEIGRQ